MRNWVYAAAEDNDPYSPRVGTDNCLKRICGDNKSFVGTRAAEGSMRFFSAVRRPRHVGALGVMCLCSCGLKLTQVSLAEDGGACIFVEVSRK